MKDNLSSHLDIVKVELTSTLKSYNVILNLLSTIEFFNRNHPKKKICV